MALPKLYEPITWVNDSAPALNEDNLNAISQGLSDVDDRVISLAGTIMEDVPQIQEDMEIIEAGLETVGQAVTDSQTAATSAAADKLVSEGWAKGTQNGSAVGSSSPYYHNNAEYFKDQARSFTPTGYQDLVDDVGELKEALTDLTNYDANMGVKNQLPNNAASTTINQVTFTVNSDKSVTVNGTASGNCYFNIVTKTFGNAIIRSNTQENVPVGDWILTTGAQTDDKFYMAYNPENHITAIAVLSGKTVNNVTIYPMIRDASISDPTYQPYAMTNQELTANKLDKAVTTLTSNDDLNNIKETGFYGITTAPTNSPENKTYYHMQVMTREDGSVGQICYTGANIYVRRGSGSPFAWGVWYKYNGTALE